jgi:hypothetical protein
MRGLVAIIGFSCDWKSASRIDAGCPLQTVATVSRARLAHPLETPQGRFLPDDHPGCEVV